MAYTDIYPTTMDAERVMTDHQEKLRKVIRTALNEVWGRPDTDIITNMHLATVTSVDPVAAELGIVPDLKIVIATSDQELKPKAKDLRERILTDFGREFGRKLSAEVWIWFFDCWGTTIE